MKKQPEKPTQTMLTAYEEAKKEARFSARDLVQELTPLLQEYFFVEFSQEENTLLLVFPNGQKFALTVNEI